MRSTTPVSCSEELDDARATSRPTKAKLRVEATVGVAFVRECEVARFVKMTLTAGMKLLADFLVGLVALLHVWFMVLEMFLWTKPYGRRTFGLTVERAEMTKSLAANQGLYNGFLAAGLIWGLLAGADGYVIKVFFLGCIIIAGIFGAATVGRKILWIQAVPAAIALALVCSVNS